MALATPALVLCKGCFEFSVLYIVVLILITGAALLRDAVSFTLLTKLLAAVVRGAFETLFSSCF